MHQTFLNIFAECFNTISVCASEPNVKEFPWERFCLFLCHSFPSEISKEHIHDYGASSWTFSLSWSVKPHSRNISKQLPKFFWLLQHATWEAVPLCCMRPGFLCHHRCIWVLDTPDMDLVSWIVFGSWTDFECLITDSCWYFHVCWPRPCSLSFLYNKWR